MINNYDMTHRERGGIFADGDAAGFGFLPVLEAMQRSIDMQTLIFQNKVIMNALERIAGPASRPPSRRPSKDSLAIAGS